MSLITDESDSFVESVVRKMDDAMTAILKAGKNRSRLDAALLCALDFCSDKLTAEKRVRNLEAQISLYDVNLRKARQENAELRAKLGIGGGAVPPEQTRLDEPAPEEEKAEPKPEPDREEKLRMIESMLKGRKKD